MTDPYAFYGNMVKMNNEMAMRGADSISQGLMSLANAYGESESQKAKGRAFKDVFKVVSPSLGISMEQLEAVSGGKLKNDRDWFQASEMLMPMMPSLINAQLANRSAGIRENQQQLTARMPGLRNQANNQMDVINQGGPSIGGATRRFGQ